MLCLLDSLDVKKATGYDGISAQILKISAPAIHIPLVHIFNKCIDANIFPTRCKMATVSPVFKKDDSLQKKNYRPVSILSIISKVFEKAIAKQLLIFENRILHPNISAFRSGFSCQSVLINVVENWKRALDRNMYIGTALMDLSKAFDCIPHALLLSKLHSYGMHRKSVDFIASYLTNRKQCVKIGSIHSEWQNLSKGVRQGSVLGPALFNIFLNDIYGFITDAELYNYADDNTNAAMAEKLDTVKTILQTQSLNAIKWFNDNLMEANPSKFQVMILHRSKSQVDFAMCLYGVDLRVEDSVKLLGVIIDAKMTFNLHSQSICHKAGAQLNALYRINNFLDQNSKLAIVRSFKYCPLVCHFCGKFNRNKMEKILKRALRCALDDKTSDYNILLQKANMSSLELDRLRSIGLEVYKILNNLNPLYLSDLVTITNGPFFTRQKYNINIPRVKTVTFGQHSLRYLAPKIWNDLPIIVRNSDSIRAFKDNIKIWSGFSCKCSMCR